jgi:hypothetical protein
MLFAFAGKISRRQSLALSAKHWAKLLVKGTFDLLRSQTTINILISTPTTNILEAIFCLLSALRHLEVSVHDTANSYYAL